MPDRIEDLTPSEPYLRLARRGREVWNRWVGTGMDYDLDLAAEFGLEAVKPLDEIEARALAVELGLERLPGYDRPPNFDGVDFTQDDNRRINFSGFVFAPARSFMEKLRDADGQEQETRRKASALFRGATLGGGPFVEATYFGGSKFGDWARFDNAIFGDDANFSGATFGTWPRFVGAVFGDGARFECARFGGQTSFDDAKFGDTTKFECAWFAFNTSFAGAAFGDQTNFDGAMFRVEAIFDAATFGASASFDGASFGGPTRFAGVTFGGRASFDGWELEALRKSIRFWFTQLGMDDAKIATRVEPRIAAARPKSFAAISFADAVFSGVCSFRNRSFEAPADLSGATFRAVPDFGGASGLDHLDLSEIAISFGRRKRFFRNWTTHSEIERRLRHFRKIAKDVEAHDLERDLFILERSAQRGIQIAPFVRLVAHLWKTLRKPRQFEFRVLRDRLRVFGPLRHLARPAGLTGLLFLYRATSDYGRSMVRPFVGFMVALAGFHWRYWWLYCDWRQQSLPLFDQDLMSFTLGNALPFAGGLNPARRDVLLRLFGSASNQILIPTQIELLSIFQSIIGAALLFLFLLAIRNRFRLG